MYNYSALKSLFCQIIVAIIAALIIALDNFISSPHLATGICSCPTGENAPDPRSWIDSSGAIFNSFNRFLVWLRFVLCFGHSNTQIDCLIHLSVASVVCREPVLCCNKNLCLSVKPLAEWNRLWPRIFLYKAPSIFSFITNFPMSSIGKTQYMAPCYTVGIVFFRVMH